MADTVASADMSKVSIFDRTSLCKFYSRGSCVRGSSCRFAHGVGNLRCIPDLAKTKLCPFIKANGVCNRPDCSYAHSKGAIRRYHSLDDNQSLVKEGVQCSLKESQQNAANAAPKLNAKILANACHASYSLSDFTKEDFDFERQATGSTTLTSSDELFDRTMTVETASSCEQDAEKDVYGADHIEGSHSSVMKVLSHINATSELEATASYESTGNMRFEAKLAEGFPTKTKMCKFNRDGICRKGSKCSFAHGEDELQPSSNVLHTKCWDMYNTESSGAAHSRYDSGIQELCILQPPESMTKEPCGTSAVDHVSRLYETGMPLRTKPFFRNTKLCKFHIEGCCKRGQNCNFAHDSALMRPLPNLRRTKMCPKSSGADGCKDANCQFAHSTSELRALQTKLMKPWSCPEVAGQLVVKHTFITWEFTAPRLRCSFSAPTISTLQ